MPSLKRPALSQDVYRCKYQGLSIYTKLQMGRRGEAVVFSFKDGADRLVLIQSRLQRVEGA